MRVYHLFTERISCLVPERRYDVQSAGHARVGRPKRRNPIIRSFRFLVAALPALACGLYAQPGHSAPPGTEYVDRLVAMGFVDAGAIDTTLLIQLKYADTTNFMGADVYGSLKRCFLRRDAAEKLVVANRLLRHRYPHLRILVADGFRPRHVQRRMWNIVKGTEMQRYVANPRYGSMHNYGCAVDVTIVDTAGVRLDMGTPIDHFGPLAQPRLEPKYLATGQLSSDQVANRHLLRDIMIEAGFYPLSIEWWHYNAFPKKEVRARYTIVE
jgi:D-alanyl-D-alanine dipeptidase